MNSTAPTLPTPRARTAAAGKRRAAPGSSASPPSDTDIHRFKRCLKDARTGLIESQYQVGLMLAAGIGTKKNTTDALAWMTRAAERGHAGAQYMLGCHFAPEPGTAPRGQLDEARAMDWLYLASRQGHARAHHRLAQLLRQAHGTLIAHHEATAAGQGLAEAQLELARQQLRPGGEEDLRSSGMAWLRRAAQSGLPAAQTELGLLCLNEAQSPASDREGLQWLQAAAQQAWPPACLELHQRRAAVPELPQPVADPLEPSARYALGLLAEQGLAGLSGSPQQAHQWFELAATQNWPAAHTALGYLAETHNPQAALAHYRAGALAGDPAAQLVLAKRLTQQAQTPNDHVQAQHYLLGAAAAGQADALMSLAESSAEPATQLADAALTLAAEAGLAEAQFRLAQQALRQGPSQAEHEAAEWLRRASDQGHPAARGALGLLLRQSTSPGTSHATSTAQRRSMGLELLRTAAKRGDPASCWNLALLLAAGGTEMDRDMPAALTLCEQAADAGFVPAMASMGVLCAALERSEEAVTWWRRAAQAGDLEAQFNFAQALANGRGTPANQPQAFEWMLQAAEAGLAPAQNQVGVMYATAQGVVLDPIEAHKWFYLARAAGDSAAKQNIKQSQPDLSRAQVDEAERRARRWRARAESPG